jgi:hypothetical protein
MHAPDDITIRVVIKPAEKRDFIVHLFVFAKAHHVGLLMSRFACLQSFYFYISANLSARRREDVCSAVGVRQHSRFLVKHDYFNFSY